MCYSNRHGDLLGFIGYTTSYPLLLIPNTTMAPQLVHSLGCPHGKKKTPVIIIAGDPPAAMSKSHGRAESMANWHWLVLNHHDSIHKCLLCILYTHLSQARRNGICMKLCHIASFSAMHGAILPVMMINRQLLLEAVHKVSPIMGHL